MAGYWNNPPKSSVDEEADHLQKLIRERFETLTNFAEGSRQAQQLAKIFKKYDVDGSGSLDFPKFQRVLVEIRCHQARESAQRALFDRYDPELDGNISLQEMLDGVFSLKPHPLAKKENRGMVEKIREQLTKRGGMNGIRSLARVFRIMDDSGNGRITHEEFLYGMHDMGVELAKQDVGHVVELFDRDKDGNIDFNELLCTLRGKLNPRRRELVDLAWTQLDRQGDGVVTMADLMDMYDVSENPEVINKRITPEQAIAQFAKVWDRDANGSIEKHEFVTYYKDISASIDDDSYFELMIRNAWHLYGGEGAAENTSNIRVLVTFEDGSSEVIALQDDLGVERNDFPLIRKRLYMQGVRDVASISLAD